MYKEIQIRIRPEAAGEENTLKRLAARQEGIQWERIVRVDVVRRSIDARQREVVFNLTLGLHIDRWRKENRCLSPVIRM